MSNITIFEGQVHQDLTDQHNAGFGIIVIQTRLGANESRGYDFHVTFRGIGDRVSPSYLIAGLVENHRVLLQGNMPMAVALHLQTSLDEAWSNYHEEARDEEPDTMRLSNGPLGYLPQEYNRVLYCKYKETRHWAIDRWFVRWSRTGLDEAVAEAAQATALPND